MSDSFRLPSIDNCDGYRVCAQLQVLEFYQPGHQVLAPGPNPQSIVSVILVHRVLTPRDADTATPLRRRKDTLPRAIPLQYVASGVTAVTRALLIVLANALPTATASTGEEEPRMSGSLVRLTV